MHCKGSPTALSDGNDSITIIFTRSRGYVQGLRRWQKAHKKGLFVKEAVPKSLKVCASVLWRKCWITVINVDIEYMVERHPTCLALGPAVPTVPLLLPLLLRLSTCSNPLVEVLVVVKLNSNGQTCLPTKTEK